MSCDCGVSVTVMIRTLKFLKRWHSFAFFQPKHRRYVDYNDDQDQEQLNKSKQAPATKPQSDVNDAHGIQALQQDSLLSLQDPYDELANSNQLYETKFGLFSRENFPSPPHYKRQRQPEDYVD